MSSRPKVFVTHCEVPSSALDSLRERCDLVICPSLPVPNRDDLLAYLPQVDAIIWCTQCRLDAQIMDQAGPGLRVIAALSAGYEHIDITEARRRGIRVGHTPNINTRATAEIAVTLVLEVTRRIPEARQAMLNNEWFPFRPQWMMGKDLFGSTVGIVGLGGVGTAVAKRLKSFEISRLLYYGRNKKPEAEALGAEFVRFEDLLKQSDYIIVACPLTDATRNLFNDETFALMKPTAIFVNIARGGIVDQGALLRALETGKIWGAGLDVMTPEPLPPDHPLKKLKNCVLSPHMGAFTEKTQAAMGELTARNILAGLDNKDLPAPVPT